MLRFRPVYVARAAQTPRDPTDVNRQAVFLGGFAAGAVDSVARVRLSPPKSGGPRRTLPTEGRHSGLAARGRQWSASTKSGEFGEWGCAALGKGGWGWG